MDKAYIDFSRLDRMHCQAAFFGRFSRSDQSAGGGSVIVRDARKCRFSDLRDDGTGRKPVLPGCGGVQAQVDNLCYGVRHRRFATYGCLEK